MTSSVNKCNAEIKRCAAILEEKKQERLKRGEGSDVIDVRRYTPVLLITIDCVG